MIDANTDRDPLEVLAEEFIERRRQGETPTIEEYADNYPDLAADIRDLFPTIAAVEQLKVEKQLTTGGKGPGPAPRLERLGDFRIIREIGRGGMGIVYEAEQESLGRHVAVKVLPKQSLLDPKHLSRFEREARTAANLHHTNIIPIFGVGEQEGYHYFVMQYIHGVGLDEVIDQLESGGSARSTCLSDSSSNNARFDDRRTTEVIEAARSLMEGRFDYAANSRATDTGSSINVQSVSQPVAEVGKPNRDAEISPASHTGNRYWRSIVGLGLQVAGALEHAHAQGVLHRDIKPANLLLDAHGFVWVADFGLAKAMEQDVVSQPGDVVGTLRYMAPERFSGHSDARSDVYGLGLTLYELAVLRPAYANSDRSKLIHSITNESVMRPRRIDSRIPLDLETIILKAIARDPSDRYQTAGELAEDLRRFVEDRPITARRARITERLWRWSKRNPAVAALAGTSLALLIAIAVVTSTGYALTKKANLQINNALADAKEQRSKAETTSALALDVLDTIFEQFAPRRITMSSSVTLESDDGVEISVPAQPVLSKEAASLLENMLAFYDRLAEQGSEDAEVRQKVADANRRVGDIRQRLGHTDQAIAAYLRAVELYEKLAESQPVASNYLVQMAAVYNDLAEMHLAVYMAMDDSQEGFAYLEKAEELLTASLPSVGETVQCRYEMARTYFLQGRRRMQDLLGGRNGPEHDNRIGPMGRRGGPRGGPSRRNPNGRPARDDVGIDRNREYLQKAIRLLEILANEHPTVPDYRHLLALCYREIPPASLGDNGSSDQVPAMHQKATEILQQLVDEYPEVPEYLYDLCETYALPPAKAQLFSMTSETIARRLNRALVIAEQLVSERPNIPDYIALQVRIRHILAMVIQRKEPRLAEEHFKKALALQSSLVEQFPKVSQYRVMMGALQEPLAALLIQRGDYDGAKALLLDSIDQLQSIELADSKEDHVWFMLSGCYQQLATVFREQGDHIAAQEAQTRAAQVMQEHHAASKDKRGLLANKEGAFQGYTLFSPLRSTSTYLIDMQGRVVHTWESDATPGQSVYLLDNGHLLRCEHVFGEEHFHGGGLGGRIREYDWDGKVVWEYVYSDENHCQHHDIEPMPNGNILLIAWERKTDEEVVEAGLDIDSPTGAELWPDHVVEVKPSYPSGGEIVWRWHVWDHLVQELDSSMDNYGVIEEHPELININFGDGAKQMDARELQHLQALGYVGSSVPDNFLHRRNPDMNHTNSIAYNAELDQILLSIHTFSEVWIIDHSTTTEEAAGHSGGKRGKGGDLLYRWGNPRAYGAGAESDQQLFAQHDAQWVKGTGRGKWSVTVFNNGGHKGRTAHSSIVEITLPLDEEGDYSQVEGRSFAPSSPSWVYTAPEKTSFFSGHISGAQRLPNGDTFICSGEKGRLFEVTSDGEIVWEYTNPIEEEMFHEVQGPGTGPLPSMRPPPGGPRGARPDPPPWGRGGMTGGPSGSGPQAGPPGSGPGGPMHGPPGGGPPGGGPHGGGPNDESYAIFRATKYAPDYPGLDGKKLVPQE